VWDTETVELMTRYETILGPNDVLLERPFTAAGHTARELDVMRTMLEYERRRGREWLEADGEAPREHVVREHDEERHRHLLVVPDTRALVAASDVTAVGFFGSPREDVDHSVLFELEEELVARMHAYAGMGLLSYYDVEMPKGAYGNLILFSTPDVPVEWHADAVHRRAVEISPSHYHAVRLHKGSISGSLLGDGDIAIERTKYFDFTGGVLWRGLRRFDADAG